MATVLALDRDRLQLELLGFLLKREHHDLIPTSEPGTALGIVRSTVIDLVVVEPSLERCDGYQVCQQIRQAIPAVPLLIVSERGAEEHIIRGLEAADDYMTKPFSPREFLARVHALLRRASLIHERRDEILSIGEIELNLFQMHALVNGTRVPLTPRELWLLYALMGNAGRVLSREQLMRVAWGEHFVGVAKTVDVCIQRIRKKLAPHLSAGGYISALRGFGYKFDSTASGVGRTGEPAGVPPPLPSVLLPS